MTSTTQVPRRGDPPGGIGGHVRHCLDHVSALLSATRTGLCALRSPPSPHGDRNVSRGGGCCHHRPYNQFLHLETASLDADVYMETPIDPSGSMSITRSSVGREVAFIVSHTIHHNAIVGQIMQARGLAVTPRFGLAPATPLDRGIVPCAQ